MKKNNKTTVSAITADELIAKFTPKKISKKAKIIIALCIVLPLICVVSNTAKMQSMDFSNDSLISMAASSVSATASRRDTISIPSGTVKANPFVPYRNIEPEDSLTDVPKFDLVAPPEVLNEGSDAARVMDTIVSGILFDKFSPSAILNIEGNDYLVKKGDTVNNYKVVNIEKNSVTVKLGKNTFKAGIGEILTEGSVNHNDVSNLSKKFGGEKR